MKYRKLGNTGIEVSCIRLGCVQLGSSRTEYAVQIVRRALELGVNYFDTARVYWDSEIKLGDPDSLLYNGDTHFPLDITTKW